MTEILFKRGRICFAHSHSLPSVVVTEHADQKQLKEEGVYWTYIQGHNLSLKEIGAGTEERRQEALRKAAHWLAPAPHGLLSRFLKDPGPHT